jgi:hypothetical protein
MMNYEYQETQYKMPNQDKVTQKKNIRFVSIVAVVTYMLVSFVLDILKGKIYPNVNEYELVVLFVYFAWSIMISILYFKENKSTIDMYLIFAFTLSVIGFVFMRNHWPGKRLFGLSFIFLSYMLWVKYKDLKRLS